MRKACRLSMTGPVGRKLSMARVNSGSSPAPISVAMLSNNSACRCTCLACATSTRPASVSTGVLLDRSNSDTPCAVSSVRTDWLIADCTRRNLRPAAEKLPVSAIVVSTRSWSRVSAPSMMYLHLRWKISQFDRFYYGSIARKSGPQHHLGPRRDDQAFAIAHTLYPARGRALLLHGRAAAASARSMGQHGGVSARHCPVPRTASQSHSDHLGPLGNRGADGQRRAGV